MTPHISPSFRRDRFTWLAYLMLAYFAYLQATLGPLMPFLRSELHMSYTVSGLHLSAFALGMALAGIIGDHLVRLWGRTRIFWGGGAGMAAGALLFILGHHPALTITSALIMGLPGTLVMIIIQAALSDRHGERRAVALTESNVAASISSGLAPLLVGSLQRAGLGWRSALLLGAVGWGALLLCFWKEPIPKTTEDSQLAVRLPLPASRKLPAIYWAYWLVVFLGVSVEWCVIFWGADFLETNVGLKKVDASTLMSVFFVAMVIGRTTGSRLSRSVSIRTLHPIAVTIAIAGFFPFWLARWAPLNIAGLFLAGLGIANLFPLTLSAASDSVLPHQADVASSRITLAAGMAILITPQILGSLADEIGIKHAYSVAAVFLMVAAGAILLAGRLALRESAGKAKQNSLKQRFRA
jgi:predicted MFS family arabinose efflux permease